MATLYHWDTPLPLERSGGWMNRATAERFAEYAAAAGKRLGDRVAQWVTLNEPVSVTLNGYALGVHAPGRDLLFNALPSVHHQLLGHGLAVQALRAAGVAGTIGVTNLHSPVRPATRRLADRLLAKVFDLVLNRVYADPILLGRYPPPPLAARPWFRFLSRTSDDDLRLISQPLDFYGVNYYYPVKVAAGQGPAETPAGKSAGHDAGAVPSGGVPRIRHHGVRLAGGTGPSGHPAAGTQGQVRGRPAAGVHHRERRKLPGARARHRSASRTRGASTTWPTTLTRRWTSTAPGGIAHDVELLGYYVWTLMDNFEWAAGYSQRFGLVHVDFETLKRTPKKSFYWLQALSRARKALRLRNPPLLVLVGPVDALGAVNLVAEMLLRPKNARHNGGNHDQEN